MKYLIISIVLSMIVTYANAQDNWAHRQWQQQQQQQQMKRLVEQQQQQLQMLEQLKQDQQFQQQNQQIQQQILIHGAGGCTPNFATGGCL